jgi:hypothetical protein
MNLQRMRLQQARAVNRIGSGSFTMGTVKGR